MSFFEKIFGSQMLVDAMVGICAHGPGIHLQPPSNVKETAKGSLSGGLKKASLSSNAKTAYLIAQGNLNFKECAEQASKDLPEQMQLFMNNNGLDPSNYDIQHFSEDLRHDIKVLWAAAVRK